MKTIFVIQERLRPRCWVPFDLTTSEREALRIMKAHHRVHGRPVRIHMYHPTIWVAELPE